MSEDLDLSTEIPLHKRQAPIPPGYAIGSHFRSFNDLFSWSGKPVIFCGRFMTWESFTYVPFRSIITALHPPAYCPQQLFRAIIDRKVKDVAPSEA